MSEAQRLKHIADRMPQQLTETVEGSSLTAAAPTLDGLGAYEGGTAALKGSNNWVALKSRATRTGDSKNVPATDYPSKITAANQKVEAEAAEPTAEDYTHAVAPLKIEESDNIPCSEGEDSYLDVVHDAPTA